MGRILTAVQLEKKLTQRKAREAYREAAAKNPALVKPYKAKGATSTIWVRSLDSENLIVKMPVFDTTITKVGANSALVNWLDQAVALPAGATLVGFKGNNKAVMRIRVNEARATPLPKNTPWGTRVVDMIDNSYSFPVGTGTTPATRTVEAMIILFSGLFGTGGQFKTLIAKDGSSAELIYRGKTISVVR
jgi:hypothetical protein